MSEPARDERDKLRSDEEWRAWEQAWSDLGNGKQPPASTFRFWFGAGWRAGRDYAERRVQGLEAERDEANAEASRYEDDAAEARRIEGELERERDEALTILQGWLAQDPADAIPQGSLEDMTTDILIACGRLKP